MPSHKCARGTPHIHGIAMALAIETFVREVSRRKFAPKAIRTMRKSLLLYFAASERIACAWLDAQHLLLQPREQQEGEWEKEIEEMLREEVHEE